MEELPKDNGEQGAMSVAELIAKLQEMPQDMMVFIPDPEGFGPDLVTDVKCESVWVLKDGNQYTGFFSTEIYRQQDGIVLRSY